MHLFKRITNQLISEQPKVVPRRRTLFENESFDGEKPVVTEPKDMEMLSREHVEQPRPIVSSAKEEILPIERPIEKEKSSDSPIAKKRVQFLKDPSSISVSPVAPEPKEKSAYPQMQLRLKERTLEDKAQTLKPVEHASLKPLQRELKEEKKSSSLFRRSLETKPVASDAFKPVEKEFVEKAVFRQPRKKQPEKEADLKPSPKASSNYEKVGAKAPKALMQSPPNLKLMGSEKTALSKPIRKSAWLEEQKRLKQQIASLESSMQAEQFSPVVNISIGALDIVTKSPHAQPPLAPVPREKVPKMKQSSLEDYLQARERGER
jgi:hypothetical protein